MNFKLTREHTVIGICVIALLCSLWTTSYYRDKANDFKIDLYSSQKELEIERNNNKLEGGLEEKQALQNELNIKNKKLTSLYKKYNYLLGSDITHTEVMEGLGEINNTQDVCDAWVRLYDINMCK